ncbi:MAG: LysM peptidoglycan-binding domain-containing protein [Anaerolineae bacterium]
MRLSHARHWLLILTLLPLLVALLSVSAADATPPACTGIYYIVQRDDTWSSVSYRTGITVAELKRLNPHAIHPNNWLWIGDRLCIPSQGIKQGYWYQVKPGDTWNKVSRATGISVQDLWRANQGLINRLFWLYIGQRIWIPAPPPGTAATAGPATDTPAPAAQASPIPTPTVQPGVTPAPEAQATVAPTVPQPAASGCSDRLSDYPNLILAYLNTAGNKPDSLRDWLAGCAALTGDPDAITTAALQTTTSTDLIVALHDPTLPPPAGNGMLLIFHSSPTGYQLAYQALGKGSVALVMADDLNLDGKPDVVWADTSCDAHTCFTELHVDSWDGTAYQDWLTGEPTMASAEYRFDDVTSEGAGLEIIAHGGTIGSVGAGPQRAWTETYISPAGAAYTLFSRVYDPSPCLYHKILDANAALNKWTTDGFDAAIDLYTQAITDTNLTACGSIPDELTTLRDFARFRLAVALLGAGRRAEAENVSRQITTPALIGAATTFFSAYRSSGSIIQACRDTNTYAQGNPASWQFLADWGYANPSFTAAELCPLQ